MYCRFAMNAKKVIREIARRNEIDLLHTHGHHYYTQMLDLIALVKGAALAEQLG